MRQPVLEQFDRDLGLAQLLPGAGAAKLADALQALLGVPVRLLDANGNPVAGPQELPGAADAAAAP